MSVSNVCLSAASWGSRARHRRGALLPRDHGNAELARCRGWHTHPAGCGATLAGCTPAEPTAQEPHVRTPKLARLEAALFAADAPLTSRRLAEVALLSDGTEARTLIRRLNQLYDSGASAFRVVQIAGGYRLFTGADFGRWLARRYRPAAETQLSSASLETLTIIAYRQPILRAEIEAIRGVQCGEILRHLLEKRMIRIVGRDNALGRPILYATSRRFLETFGLKGLDELPLADQLKRHDSATNSGPASAQTALPIDCSQ